MAEQLERFTIRWDTDMGCYRVSQPGLAYAEVVLAHVYDALLRERDALAAALLRSGSEGEGS